MSLNVPYRVSQSRCRMVFDICHVSRGTCVTRWCHILVDVSHGHCDIWKVSNNMCHPVASSLGSYSLDSLRVDELSSFVVYRELSPKCTHHFGHHYAVRVQTYQSHHHNSIFPEVVVGETTHGSAGMGCNVVRVYLWGWGGRGKVWG